MVHSETKRICVMTKKPLPNRILARKIKGKKTTRGGIAIPDTVKKAKVIAVAPGINGETDNRIPMQVKEGDRILMGKYTGAEIKIEGEEYLIISEDEVLAVIG
jgi:chaperonin GroES